MFNEFMPDQPARPSWFALSGNTVLTRAAYAAFGPFADVRAAEDVVFSRRLIGRGGRIANALRVLIKTASARRNRRAILEIV